MTGPTLQRGTVFRAEHDDSFDFWRSPEPRNKIALVFNATPVDAAADVHYFLATSKVMRYRENPAVLSDTLIFPAGTYPFFTEETLLDFSTLCTVPYAKLLGKGLQVLGSLTADDVARCARAIGAARVLENRAKRLLGLR
jgi:hypothetical protein